MNFPIHNYPFDYWRFTPEAFRSLLKAFASQFVDFAGERDFPHTIVGIGFKSPAPADCMDEFTRRFEEWKQEGVASPKTPKSWKRFGKALSPPIVLDLYRKIRGAQF